MVPLAGYVAVLLIPVPPLVPGSRPRTFAVKSICVAAAVVKAATPNNSKTPKGLLNALRNALKKVGTNRLASVQKRHTATVNPTISAKARFVMSAASFEVRNY
jgi:hypothetical protein